MFMTVDGTTVFPSRFVYMMRDIINALEDKNPFYRSQSVNLVQYPNRPRPVIELETSYEGTGIYILYRDNPLTPAENFMYIGSTIGSGHKERMRKILSHAIEVVGTGDNVLPVSKFIRDNCNKNISNIRTIFVPLPEKEFTDRNVRDMEIAVARHMKMIHPDLVKNVSFGKAPTRPKAKELAPALEGL